MKAPKTVRFADLVKASGTPEMVTLWSDPKRNLEFSRAVDENRVVTLKQVNVGSRRDFGLIGFHKERNVSFVVFPQPLRHPPGTKVIGIRYELIHTPPPDDPVSVTEGTAAGSRPGGTAHQAVSRGRPHKTAVETYEVRLLVMASTEVTVQIEASDPEQARKKARAEFSPKQVDFSDAKIQMRVRKVRRKQ